MEMNLELNMYTNVDITAKTIKASQNIANAQKADTAEAAKENAKAADGYVKSENLEKTADGIYSKEKIQKTVEEIEAQREQAFTDMISQMLGLQANAKGLQLFEGKISWDEITQADIEEAQASIEEGGDWSVDAVATRIMDMAKLLANGDASKLSTLKDAIIAGFGGAVEQMGFESMDQMPSITTETYNEVMTRFDAWEKELTGEEEVAAEIE